MTQTVVDTRPKHPTAEMLAIAAVVVGDDPPLPLEKPARVLALSAMNALGYSTVYIAERLRICERSLGSLASQYGVEMERRREFVDRPAVEFTLQGTPMKLTGKTLDAAITELAARGKTRPEICRLTGADSSTVGEHARALGVEITEEPK